ncbi:kinesin-associated protein 3 isoform X2 [Periplaneta americana]|uniref:kinesin-associated protein 3 isoform X2 n=1 Tax=Periplaneta americana TaxID=6978 RepID=UPI0037E9B26E
MQSEDARYLKRKIRSRSIDVHPTEKALVVNYELEALILGDLGDPLLGDRKECQKIIRLKSLNEDTNCAALAKEVVGKCSLIHPSKLDEVEQLIYYLQNRKGAGSTITGNVTGKVPSLEQGDSSRPSSSCSGTDSPSSAAVAAEKASITNIEGYVELLYEDIPEKVAGSALILQLARNPDNLEELGSNDAVLSALSRVLREDWKKSIELSTNIVYIFFCFSTYSQFHNVILQYKVGSLCMEVIDYELRRYDQWKDDLEIRRRKCESGNAPSQAQTQIHGPPSADLRRRVSDGLNSHNTEISAELRRTVSHIPVAAGDNRRRMVESAHSGGEGWDSRRRHVEGLTNSPTNPVTSVVVDPKEELKRMREDYEKMKRKFQNLIKKQDQLLRVSFYLLLNIAEDTRVEDKMRKKNITGMLTKTLDRDNVDLLILVVMFLKKLSLFKENVDDMSDLNVVEKLPRILMMNNGDLIHMTLNLLLNLSFTLSLRERMVRVGFLPKLVSLLNVQRHESVVLKVLYHLSMDDRCKSMFTYTDCVPMAMKMLLEGPEDDMNLELVALCINLAINKRNAQIMVENNRLRCLMARAFRNQDSLIMKMIRNIAMHEGTKQNFVEFVGDIAKAIVECPNEDFVVECVGVLGNMTLPDLDFCQLMQRFNLIPWVQNILVPAKQEDDEMVLQIIYVFYMISRHTTTRDYLIKETEAPAYLIDLMHDKNTQIRRICNHCLDIIAGWNKEWADRIKLEKFRWHNSQWLDMVENSMDDKDFGIPSDDLPPFINGDLMHLYPTGSQMSLNIPNEENSRDNASDSANRPKSGRYSRDFETEFGDDHLVHGKSSASLSTSNSSEDLVRSGLNNLVLGPILSETELDTTDQSQYVMI